MSYTQTGRLGIAEYSVPAGQSVIHTDFDSTAPGTIAVHPSAGATATVSITISSPDRISAGTARWVPAALGEAGVVTAPAMTDIPSPLTGIRVVAAGGTVVFEVAQ